MHMSERMEQPMSQERHEERFRELFSAGQWLEALRYAIRNRVPMAHEDPADVPPEDRWSTNEMIRKISEAQDRAKERGNREEFSLLEEQYRGILRELFYDDPVFVEEEYERTKRDFDAEE